jgi:hypothetical protein
MDDLPYSGQTVDRRAFSRLPERLQRSIASVSLIVVFGAIYALVPYNQELLDRLYGSPAFSFTGRQFFVMAAASYACIIVMYHLLVPCLGSSKSLRFSAAGSSTRIE